MSNKAQNPPNSDGFFLTSPCAHTMNRAVVITGSRAFTLIELLIVVAIIAILAAIAVPNFLEAQTRAKVARVTADMRTMLTAIETYRVDNNKLPTRCDDYQSATPNPDYVPDGDTKMGDPAEPDASVGLKMITTPISYLASVPLDVFNTPAREVEQTFPGSTPGLDYWDDRQVQEFRNEFIFAANKKKSKQGFALLSVGPDKYIGLNGSYASHKYPEEPGYLRATIKWFYDPTNGTSSYGNVYRFSDNLQQGDMGY